MYIGSTAWRFHNASWEIEVKEPATCSGANAVQIEVYCGKTLVEAEPLSGANWFKNVPGVRYNATVEPSVRHFTKCATHPFEVLMTNRNNETGTNGCTYRFAPLDIAVEMEYYSDY